MSALRLPRARALTLRGIPARVKFYAVARAASQLVLVENRFVVFRRLRSLESSNVSVSYAKSAPVVTCARAQSESAEMQYAGATPAASVPPPRPPIVPHPEAVDGGRTRSIDLFEKLKQIGEGTYGEARGLGLDLPSCPALSLFTRSGRMLAKSMQAP